jgi:hypothetical protein
MLDQALAEDGFNVGIEQLFVSLERPLSNLTGELCDEDARKRAN